MKKDKLLQMGLVSAAAMAVIPAAAQKGGAQRPNVIIIYADDMGYGDLSCNGEPTISTPNVERLAREGIRFTNAHTTSSVSTPARFGLLTGVYPWRFPDTGIAPGDAAMIIRPERYTMADMMKSAGYTTAAVGKWHLGLGDVRGRQDWNGEITPGLKDIGFDYSYIMAATADRVPCVYIENSRVVDLDPADPISVSYNKPFEGVPTGRSNPELVYKMKPSPNHGHDQAIVNGISRIGYMKGGTRALWRDEDIADRITQKAVDFICASKDTAFFLYFGTNDIHVPRVPNERFQGKSGMGYRGDAILEFDYTVGRVMQVLDSLGIANNTLLIVSSDNGPVVDDGYQDQAVTLLGSHRPWGDFRGGKYSIFEAGTRVPMVMRWKGHIKAGKVSPAMVSHIDLLASLAQLTGTTLPAGVAADSRPCLNRFLGKDKSNREFVVEQSPWGLAIITDNCKYIAPNRGGRYNALTRTELGNDTVPQYYLLNGDINERHNRAADHPAEVNKLKALLQEITKQENE